MTPRGETGTISLVHFELRSWKISVAALADDISHQTYSLETALSSAAE